MTAILWIIGAVVLVLVLLVGWGLLAMAARLDQDDEDNLGVRRS